MSVVRTLFVAFLLLLTALLNFFHLLPISVVEDIAAAGERYEARQ